MSVYIMGAVYVVAGVLHFIKPRFYLEIMPPYLPFHQAFVALSGAIEILLGILLFFPSVRSWAAWGIIVLLIVIFPANLYMAYADKFQALSPWIRWGRLPLQLVLIWWAYQYTQQTS